MKFTILSSVLAATFAAAPAFAASNLDTDWGTHGDEATAFVTKAGFGKFIDTFSFTLTGKSDLSATLFSAISDPSKGNFSGQFRLFSGLIDDGVSDSQIGSMFSFNKNSPAVEGMTFANLLPGSYYYELQGELSKVGGTKFYALDSLATPSAPTPAVPEPETYAMLLAGLGVVGMAVRRRTK